MKLNLIVFVLLNYYVLVIQPIIVHRDPVEHPFWRFIRNNLHLQFSFRYPTFRYLNEYDFIIVGAGPAGCVLANRLSENPDIKVLLLEAGQAELSIFSDVMVAAPTLQATQYNWGYVTEPQREACRAMIGQSCRFPHGRGLGGSSIINYKLFTRGNRRDFDRWAAAGNPGWSYNDVLPFFMKYENVNIQKQSFLQNRGTSGPVNVEDVQFYSKIADAYVKSAQDYGLPYVDYNGPEQIGVSYFQSSTKNGWRFTAAESYLQPVARRKNLHISPDSWVTKLFFNKRNPSIVEAVRFVRKKKEYMVRARKEIILSAGTFQSPKLLMLSGVGPRTDLENLGIKVIRDLPVGQTLYEHIGLLGPIYVLDNLNDGLVTNRNLFTPAIIAKWFRGQGPMTTSGVESLAYFKTNHSVSLDRGYPDIELMQSMETNAFDFTPTTRIGMGIREEDHNAVFAPLNNRRSFFFISMLLHPSSKGYIKLKSTNPFDHPLLHPNFYHDYNDIRIQIDSIRTAQNIMQKSSFKKLGARKYKANVLGCEPFTFDTDEYWDCYIRHFSTPIHHQVGTCKMGPKDDPSSVVNNQLLVHGFKNLRVIDVSIIPEGPSGHTEAYSYLIGERGADLIKQKWQI